MKVVGKHYRIHGDMSVWHKNIIISRETYYVRPWENIFLSSHLGKATAIHGNAFCMAMHTYFIWEGIRETRKYTNVMLCRNLKL